MQQNYLDALPPEMKNSQSREQWARIGPHRRLGVVVPLFSARTTDSCGIGEYCDIERLVDWCAAIGASILQLLPLNDLGQGTGPYSALSAFALDPTYISLKWLSKRVNSPDWDQRVVEAARLLEPASRVEYARVRELKYPLLREAFERCEAELEQDPDYLRFLSTSSWLDSYVAFRVLKELHGWRAWEEWSAGRTAVEWQAEAEAQYGRELAFHRFLQWVAAAQLSAARVYAEQHGVLLKGDIPILVARDSVDVWRYPHYFYMNATAGAPPDMYAAEGQNWGFPTYNWDALAADGYGWWRRRLRSLEPYFHMYRVDHVVGFFRIWTIPLGEQNGLRGAFVPADERTWGHHGWLLLSMMLESTHLLPLAEDLGTVPDDARNCLSDLRIPGLKVARWEKRWHGDRTFIQPGDYPWLSVATSSTHDSETLAGWWGEFPAEREQLHRELGLPGQAPPRLTVPLAERLLGDLARARSIFTILPIWDILHLATEGGYLFEDDRANRVNCPGAYHETDWTFRLPRPLEQLLGDHQLNQRVKGILRRG